MRRRGYLGLVGSLFGAGCSTTARDGPSSTPSPQKEGSQKDTIHPSIPQSLDKMTSVGNGWLGPTPPEVQLHGVLVFNTGSIEHRLESVTYQDGKQVHRGSGIPLEPNTYILERLTVPATYRFRYWNDSVEARFIIDESYFSHQQSATAVEFVDGDSYVQTSNSVDWYALFKENEPRN